ncbi:D-isomer specific 2-hydroxyacid dehydrogenase family protein [Ruicaihuangia caeni]|uniref:D-isomer specific 2-hydroxyacid dehydrogenase family protein n=1 Tax=Ruicaihuangia caeni TaxID=3042517 RepID=A0AAW6T2F1_9MICO|nr:D-isomer specific 2-hydroxyacid dehydrogenase family protein [Klugiella sp. YN-L-19]MDI2097957.1 D-isomer specific 2-hydroxyacid dehydrogenase family protein [Klugiella sp. YN-L-19]
MNARGHIDRTVPVEGDHTRRRPEPGPIAVLPHADPVFVEAIEAAGGTVEPLSERTRGVVWLSARESSGLAAALDEHPDIHWVQLPWAGVDAFLELFKARAGEEWPLWTSAKGAYSEPVAEHALALTLATLRFIPQKSRASEWDPVRRGTSLYGRNVVIVGAGGIAQELLRLLAPFDTRVTVVRRRDAPVEGAERTVTGEHLADVLPDADVVVLAAAQSERTSGMLGEHELGLLKPSAVVVNIARGPLIDTDALVAALERGAIAGAGIDVTDPEPLPHGHPLFSAPNTVVTMHSADTPEMTRPLLAARIEHNVRAFLGDGDFIGVVDPEHGY